MSKWRIKSLEMILAHAEEKPLTKSLGALDLMLLGIGCIIGTGIFVLTGVAAAQYAGPALVLSFVLSGVACAFAAMMYAELSSMVPVSGSAYTYTYGVLGEAAAWIVGWNLMLEYGLGAATVASGWSGYMVGILQTAGIHLPKAITSVPADGGIVNLPAMLIVAFITYLLIRGMKESKRFNMVLVGIKLVAIFIFLFVATPHINPANWEPFMPFGFAGVSTGAAIIFFAYIGFDAVATAAEEARNPNRDMPIGLIGSLIVCTLLYVAVSGVMTGIVPYHLLNNSEPLAFALREIGYSFGSALVATGAIAGITTVILVLMYGQTRIFFVMSRDGLLPKKTCELHPKYNTPYLVTLVTGGFVMLFTGFLPIRLIAEMTNIGTLFAFVVVAIGVMILRKTKPDMRRPFRCPAVWVTGTCAVLSCSYLMISLPADTWMRFAIWSLIGMLVYAFYGYRRSPLHPRNHVAQ